jgi:hypothetical protein
VPLRIPTSTGLLGTFELFVAFDSSLLRLVEVVPAVHVVATIDANGAVAGVVRLAGTTTGAVSSPATLSAMDPPVCELRFEAVGPTTGASRVEVYVSAVFEATGAAVAGPATIPGASVASAVVQRIGQSALDSDAVTQLNSSTEAFPPAAPVCSTNGDPNSCAVTITDVEAVARVVRQQDFGGDLAGLDIDGNGAVDERDVVAAVNAYLGRTDVLRLVPLAPPSVTVPTARVHSTHSRSLSVLSLTHLHRFACVRLHVF